MAIERVIGQVLLEVTFAVVFQHLPHVIQRDLRQLNLFTTASSRLTVSVAHLGLGIHFLDNLTQMSHQQFRGDFFLENGGVQKRIARQSEKFTAAFNHDRFGRATAQINRQNLISPFLRPAVQEWQCHGLLF